MSAPQPPEAADPGLALVPMTRHKGGAAPAAEGTVQVAGGTFQVAGGTFQAAGCTVQATEDVVAVEAPLELVVAGVPLAVLLRTPGEDLDLAAGYLATEGLVDDPADVAHLGHCTDENRAQRQNRVVVALAAGVSRARVEAAARPGWTSAGCGACGKTRIAQVLRQLPPRNAPMALELAQVARLLAALEAGQPRFAATGGLHGAAVFDAGGALLALREDVGRHNAVDKALGACLRAGRWPLEDATLVVSSRAGFEIVHKALAARVGAVVAVGAASSLAIELAAAARVALYAFVRPGRMNRYV